LELTSLSKDYPNLSLAFNKSIEDATGNTNCLIYPVHDFRFRAARATWIDITISVFVLGK
jgi:hypothetical protein